MSTPCFRNKIRLGVMGSASGPLLKDKEILSKSFAIGEAIAEADCILINGACPGLPDEAAKGAQSKGSVVFGISPAYSKKEHVSEYFSPLTADFIIYTGMGFMERDIINIRSSDGVIIIGGGIGTLNEFIIAYDELQPIGILSDTKGIADKIPHILELCHREMKENVIIDNDPHKLVKKIIKYIKTHAAPVHEDSRIRDLGIPG